jgi:hypothetical protein
VNRLRQLEQEALAKGREWTRRKLEEQLKDHSDAMPTVCPNTGEGLKDVRGRQLQLITILGGQTITATLEGLWTDIGPTGLHLVAQGRGAGQKSRRTPSVELTFTSNLRMHRLVQLVSIKACACDKLI